MIHKSTIYRLARMYLEAEINHWENIGMLDEADPSKAAKSLAGPSSQRSVVSYKRLLDDLIHGNIVDDLKNYIWR
jgi:hypothetical protein